MYLHSHVHDVRPDVYLNTRFQFKFKYISDDGTFLHTVCQLGSGTSKKQYDVVKEIYVNVLLDAMLIII